MSREALSFGIAETGRMDKAEEIFEGIVSLVYFYGFTTSHPVQSGPVQCTRRLFFIIPTRHRSRSGLEVVSTTKQAPQPKSDGAEWTRL